jgi:hypothetical protein
MCAITILHWPFQIRAAIAAANDTWDESKRMAMTEQQERLAREREEIASRVANFKATQKKFEREREEYYVTTLSNAWDGFHRPPFWT